MSLYFAGYFTERPKNNIININILLNFANVIQPVCLLNKKF
jgi:hypothetical protein